MSGKPWMVKLRRKMEKGSVLSRLKAFVMTSVTVALPLGEYAMVKFVHGVVLAPFLLTGKS